LDLYCQPIDFADDYKKTVRTIDSDNQ